MYLVQQLTPEIRRIRVARPDAGEPLPDPALCDHARTLLERAPVLELATLEEALGASGVRLTRLGYGTRCGKVKLDLALAPGERLYGAADADATGLQRRGDHVHLTNELHPRGKHRMVTACELCASGPAQQDEGGLEIGQDSNYAELHLPIVLSSDGWAMYVANAWDDAVLDLGQRDPDELTYRAAGGEADVYLFGPGLGIEQLVRTVAQLTGRQPLPPTWALGFLQSRFGYGSFDHVHGVLDRFEQEQLPVHGVVFDVQWLEDHVNLRWDPEHFPDPAANLARMAQRGVRSVVITEPGTAQVASNHASGAARSAFAADERGGEFHSDQWYSVRGIEGYRDITPSPGALLNVFREDACDWWYDQHLPLLEQGVDAWWLDLNEPEDVGSAVRFPDTDWPAARAELDGAEVRNRFALAQQRLFARRDRAHTDRRPFCLSRAGSTGSQRYGAAPWTGDVGSTWEDLRIQPRLSLTAGLCGLPLTGSDAGGFFGDPGPELFARWMQLASVLPVFRAHGCLTDREPWSQGEAALDAIRPALVLRAQLLPSIASWTRAALVAGEPLARPMLLGPLGGDAATAAAHGADPRWADAHDQWYFGPLLVAPQLEEGATSRTVELPAGSWTELWSGTRHDGPARVEVATPIEALPVFVEGGTALLTDPDPLARRAHSWPPSQLEAWTFVDLADGSDAAPAARLYVDDGITCEHEGGMYCELDVLVTGAGVTATRRSGSMTGPRIAQAAPHPGRIDLVD